MSKPLFGNWPLVYTYGMKNGRRLLGLGAGFWVVAALLGGWPLRPLCAQWAALPTSGPFELSDAVEVDRVDHAVQVQLDRIDSLLAGRRWRESLDAIAQLPSSADRQLVAMANRRFVDLSEWRSRRLLHLPPEALKIYRTQVDAMVRSWYERGIANRDSRLLERVADQALASSYGVAALAALGAVAFESGEYDAARRYWEKAASIDSIAVAADSHFDLATIRARLVLVSIVAGQRARARGELTEFVRLHPDAVGRLAGHEGRYAEILASLFAESEHWPVEKIADADWPTFAGNSARNKIAGPLIDVGLPIWRVALRTKINTKDAGIANLLKPEGEDLRRPLSFFPLTFGGRALVSDEEKIYAVDEATGRPAWGKNVVFYRNENPGALDAPIVGVFGVPRFTMTVFGNRLFVRLGSTLTGRPNGSGFSQSPGRLACLDMAAEGRLLWKATPDEGWAFDGAPIVDRGGVYVAMRRQDIRPQAYVACFDADSGRLRWRRFICSAETPPRGAMFEQTHNLLTLSAGVLYFNTNLGAVASLRADDGRILWLTTYPRSLQGDLAKLSPHWRRDLTPCVFDRGTLYVAPTDSPSVFAFDAATGQPIWQTGDETGDVLNLLGVSPSGRWLIAGGGRLCWISLQSASLGRVKRRWPDGPERPGFGRGVLAGDRVLWTTREQLYAFDVETARLEKTFDLASLGLTGGNLLVDRGHLLIATEDELIAVGLRGGVKRAENATKN